MTQAKCYCNDVSDSGRGHFPHHPSYPHWLTQWGKTVRITHGAFMGETGRIGGFAAFSADVRIPDKTTVNIHYDDLEVVSHCTACCDCPSVPAPFKPTKEDIGKKCLVVRGILKGEEGTLSFINTGEYFEKDSVELNFASPTYSFWVRMPFEDLEPVE